jgi:hypothetical protein
MSVPFYSFTNFSEIRIKFQEARDNSKTIISQNLKGKRQNYDSKAVKFHPAQPPGNSPFLSSRLQVSSFKTTPPPPFRKRGKLV